MHGLGGLHGWQWPFPIEGSVSVVVGIIADVFLDSRISHAKWRTPAGKSARQEVVYFATRAADRDGKHRQCFVASVLMAAPRYRRARGRPPWAALPLLCIAAGPGGPGPVSAPPALWPAGPAEQPRQRRRSPPKSLWEDGPRVAMDHSW